MGEPGGRKKAGDRGGRKGKMGDSRGAKGGPEETESRAPG